MRARAARLTPWSRLRVACSISSSAAVECTRASAARRSSAAAVVHGDAGEHSFVLDAR
jgi:hypothetical protein